MFASDAAQSRLPRLSSPTSTITTDATMTANKADAIWATPIPVAFKACSVSLEEARLRGFKEMTMALRGHLTGTADVHAFSHSTTPRARSRSPRFTAALPSMSARGVINRGDEVELKPSSPLLGDPAEFRELPRITYPRSSKSWADRGVYSSPNSSPPGLRDSRAEHSSPNSSPPGSRDSRSADGTSAAKSFPQLTPSSRGGRKHPLIGRSTSFEALTGAAAVAGRHAGEHTGKKALFSAIADGEVAMLKATWLLHRAGYERRAELKMITEAMLSSLEAEVAAGTVVFLERDAHNGVVIVEVQRWLKVRESKPLLGRKQLEETQPEAYATVGDLQAGARSFAATRRGATRSASKDKGESERRERSEREPAAEHRAEMSVCVSVSTQQPMGGLQLL